MAANFWLSSHRDEWLLDESRLRAERLNDLQSISELEYQKLMAFFALYISELGKRCKVKRHVISTAIVYFRRFYSNFPFQCVDPCLLAPTCFYLATKVDEFALFAINIVIKNCNDLCEQWPFVGDRNGKFPYDQALIFELEFYLLEVMDCSLIVYEPYRPMVEYLSNDDFNRSDKDGDIWSDEERKKLEYNSWCLINDTYSSDMCICHPPHLIALGVIFIVMLRENKTNTLRWFARLDLELELLSDVLRNIQELQRNILDDFKERVLDCIPGILKKIPKPVIKEVDDRRTAQNVHDSYRPGKRQYIQHDRNNPHEITKKSRIVAQNNQTTNNNLMKHAGRKPNNQQHFQQNMVSSSQNSGYSMNQNMRMNHQMNNHNMNQNDNASSQFRTRQQFAGGDQQQQQINQVHFDPNWTNNDNQKVSQSHTDILKRQQQQQQQHHHHHHQQQQQAHMPPPQQQQTMYLGGLNSSMANSQVTSSTNYRQMQSNVQQNPNQITSQLTMHNQQNNIHRVPQTKLPHNINNLNNNNNNLIGSGVSSSIRQMTNHNTNNNNPHYNQIYNNNNHNLHPSQINSNMMRPTDDSNQFTNNNNMINHPMNTHNISHLQKK
ncbi:hypothetical protein SNEBB_003291 [Seison nebaliae]|nr:hypothetical protein SNEBB_003291 [Seison nebaliae]